MNEMYSIKGRLPAKDFQDLIMWQKAHQFVLNVYRLTENFPSKEIYGLTTQFRRAAISIAANIAEGFRKRGRAGTARFLNISEGSLQECKYFFMLAKDLGYAETSTLAGELDEIGKMLNVYSQRLLTPRS
jgi:four helix bundle protein